MLPVKVMTQPVRAPLNLAAMMPRDCNPTDLGPKTYIAYGQVSVGGEGGVGVDG